MKQEDYKKAGPLFKSLKKIEADLARSEKLKRRVVNKKEDSEMYIEIDQEDIRLKVSKTKALDLLGIMIGEIESEKERLTTLIEEI